MVYTWEKINIVSTVSVKNDIGQSRGKQLFRIPLFKSYVISTY